VEELQRRLSSEAIDQAQTLTVLRAGDRVELQVLPIELAAA
jgi:hypothetical protein